MLDKGKLAYDIVSAIYNDLNDRSGVLSDIDRDDLDDIQQEQFELVLKILKERK